MNGVNEANEGERTRRVLVTGANGLVGRAAVAALSEAGHRVVATDVREPYFEMRAPFVAADLTDAGEAHALVGRMFGGTFGADGPFEAVVHAAAIPSPGGHAPHVVFENNLTATFNVVEACVRRVVGRLVNISSVGVIGVHYAERRFFPDYLPYDEEHPTRPQDPYGLAKLFGEQLCDAAARRSDLKCISLRPPWVHDAESYADLGPLVRSSSPPGVAGWPYVDARDLAEAIGFSVESDLSGHEVFFVAAPDTIGGHDLHVSWRSANPHAPTELRRVNRPDASGIDSGKAERLLGWRARRGWRDYFTESGEPRKHAVERNP